MVPFGYYDVKIPSGHLTKHWKWYQWKDVDGGGGGDGDGEFLYS